MYVYINFSTFTSTFIPQNEVAAFLSKALTMPKPTVVSKPVATLVSSLSTGTDGVTVLKVKEPRGKKDRGETKDGKVKRNYYQEKKRKLAELIAMGVSVDSCEFFSPTFTYID